MIQYDYDVHCVDTEYIRPGVACLYLVCHQGRIAIIDTGTSHTVPHLLNTIATLGMTPDAVDYVIPTHVHLDHAGGAGALLQACPNARLIIHPRGQRHMIDPSKLINAAAAVYGQERFDRLYGALVPADASRVSVVNDGDVINLAGRTLAVLDTPGHARHHICLWDETSQGMFTGDTCGLSYRELDGTSSAQTYLFATTSPTQFDPDALHDSVNRVMSYQPKWLYLTHFGRVAVSDLLIDQLHQSIDAFVAVAELYASHANRKSAIEAGLAEYVSQQIHDHGVDSQTLHAIIKNDMDLNAQGLDYWLAHR